jgi:hypothetical protein
MQRLFFSDHSPRKKGKSKGKEVFELTLLSYINGCEYIPSFLHLALECVEKKGGGEKTKGSKKRKERP